MWIKSQFVLNMNKQSKSTTWLEPQVMNVFLFLITILNAPLPPSIPLHPHPSLEKKEDKRQSMKSWIYPQSTMLKYKNLVTKFTQTPVVYKVMKMKKHAAKLWHLSDNIVSLYNCNWAYIYIYNIMSTTIIIKLIGKKEKKAKYTVETL